MGRNTFCSNLTTNGMFYLGQIISIEAIRLFEGDMVFTPAQREAAEQGRDFNFAVGRSTSKYYLWPSGVVPFSIEQQLSKYFHLIDTQNVDTVNCSMM